VDYFYFTANGETGLFDGFVDLIRSIIDAGAQVGVLCASHLTIITGLSHAEISFNKTTLTSAKRATQKAKSLGIPFALSLVDDGDSAFLEYARREAIILGADAVLTRAQQPEGRSTQTIGETIVQFATERLPVVFPVKAYRELQDLPKGSTPICINPFGQVVDFLGGEPFSVSA
jgi:hypothetical protein